MYHYTFALIGSERADGVRRLLRGITALIIIIVMSKSTPVQAQTDQKVLFETGVTLYKQGQYQEAIDLFTALIEIAPDNAKVYKNRGVAFMSLQKMDEAIDDFHRALSIRPDLKGLYSNLGAAWHYKGAYEKAITNYDIAIAEEPSRYITYFNRALSLVAVNRLEAAIADLEKTIALYPGFEPALSARREVQKMMAQTGGETFAVQTGAFLVETNATEMMQHLMEIGIDANVVVRTDAKQRIWYLVRCGNSLTREEAKKLQSRLKKQHRLDSVIRPMHSF